ncbi:NYN domain-containing protein [Bacteroides fragilis]
MIESITSIGIFIDGGYFTKINQALEEKLSLNIDITFFFKFIKEKIAYEYNLNTEFCQITESHYFRGRYRVNDANNKHLLFSERKFEDSLIENDVIFHYKHLREIQKEGEINVIEKGIDVWFALEAYELSLFRKFDFVILITGDADHEMLIKKLKALKIHTILLTWDLSPESATARLLREEACKHIELSEIAIEDKDLIKKICRSKQRDKKHLFLLGGHDLEMQTIVQILTDRNVIFKDRYLQWDNALLSQYEEEIQQYGNKEPFIIYGVELKEDITPPLTIFELITIMNMLPILRHWNK